MANPQQPQGILNRIKASVSWTSAPDLNVTSSFLGREGISLGFDGAATTPIPTMTGAVMSPEPYQQVTLVMNLIKAQALANQYEQRRLLNTLLGDGIVYPDTVAGGLGNYAITNASIMNVRELNFAGGDAGYVVSVVGYYLINSSLFN